MFKISIIVPIYNVQKFLPQCLDSIIYQTYPNLEIILINDGSTDASPAICQFYAERDNRINFINQSNQGLGATYNKGIRLATGHYLGFVEPDDWLEKDMYEKLASCALRNNADMIKCHFYEYRSTQEQTDYVRIGIKGVECQEPANEFILKDYPQLAAYHSSIWATLYKADFVKQIRFPEVKHRAGYVDATFMFEALARAKSISILPECLYHWRLDNQGNSVTIRDERALDMPERFLEAKEILKRHSIYKDIFWWFILHACNANIVYYKGVKLPVKRKFFKKLQALFDDVNLEEMENIDFLHPVYKKWIRNIRTNRFYRTLFIE